MAIRLERLRLMVLVPDADSRATLRDALANVVFRAEVFTLRRLEEALQHLSKDPSMHAIFFASSYGVAQIKAFIGDLGALPTAPDAAMILTVDRHTSNKLASVIDTYLNGVDGFISEPYSSDQLQELLEKILDPKRERVVQASARALKSVELLAREAVGHIDRMWRFRLEGGQGSGAALGELKRLSPSFADLQQKHPDEFLRGISRVFEEVPPPDPKDLPVRRSAKAQKVSHPGAVVRQLMEQRGLTKERLLPLLRISHEEFEQLLAEQLSLTDVIARELARALGKTAREWMTLQRNFDLTKNPEKAAQ